MSERSASTLSAGWESAEDSAAQSPLSRAWSFAQRLDPRITIAVILLAYLALGFTVLGFNRTPSQALITTASACALEVFLCRTLRGTWVLPLSAMITSFSLSILLNYSHDYFVLALPVFLAIGTKYLFTFEGRHLYNPALAGLVFSLLLSEGLVTAAPAYQWNGIESMSVFMAMLAIFFLLPRVRRHALVISFLITFTVLTALRAWIMRWHLPFETLFLGTLSSPAFFLFTFFMITDPATSPSDRRQQIALGVGLAFVDLLFHIGQSYYTFFYAAASIQTGRLLFLHARAAWREGSLLRYARQRFFIDGYYRRPLVLGAIALAGLAAYRGTIQPNLPIEQLPWKLVEQTPDHTGITGELGNVLERTDPKIHHIAKWLLSVGDAVAVGDFDGDGRMDLFFTQPLKADHERNALYRNQGDFRFERIPLPALEEKTAKVEDNGLSTAALFVDYDNDGDKDLFITFASGTQVLLQNQLAATGVASFIDVSRQVGVDRYANPMAVNFFDANQDGRLDLMVGNVLPHDLPDYQPPRPLNLFHLPEPEFEGDERMFDFMHSSWHMSDNGGSNDFYLQTASGVFEKQDNEAWGLSATMWTLAIGTGDFDKDGDTDLYVANDFGPDDLYLNDKGQRFESIKGTMFGSIGRDTYKGMNASVADVNNDGYLDVYISNVHHALQAEGSLLWMFGPVGPDGRPAVEDRATELGALNESRFGWGASLTDFDNDGWVDIAQANGMVDDTIDRRFEECPDYWYVNEKIARSPPSIHRMANKWGDIRGFCIYGRERNRLYLNRASGHSRRFVDAAEPLGFPDTSSSRGMAAVDLDNDGRRDLVVTHQFGPPTIYNNVATDHPSWIGFELIGDGEQCNRDALGTTVEISYPGDDGPVRQMRELQAATGFSAQDDPRAHFGLAAYTGPVDIQIDWCGRRITRQRGLSPNRYHRINLKEVSAATSALKDSGTGACAEAPPESGHRACDRSL